MLSFYLSKFRSLALPFASVMFLLSTLVSGPTGHAQTAQIPAPGELAKSGGLVPNIVPIDQRWIEDDWARRCMEVKSTLTDALDRSRDHLVDSKTLSPLGYFKALQVLANALNGVAKDTRYSAKRFHPVAVRLAKLGLDLDLALRAAAEGDKLDYYERSYRSLEVLTEFAIKKVTDFDEKIYGQFAVRPQFDVRLIESAYLQFTSELFQELVLKQSQHRYVGMDGEMRSAPQGSFNAFFSTVSLLTDFTYRELSTNLYGPLNGCAVSEIKLANNIASRWLTNYQQKTEQDDQRIYVQILKVIDRIPILSTDPKCEFLRQNPFIYPLNHTSRPPAITPNSIRQ